MGRLSKHIAWENALECFFNEGFKPGDIIKKEWLEEKFHLRKLDSLVDIKEHNERQILFMANMKHFKDALLERHQLLMRNVRGVGYEIIHPKDQTSYSMETGANAVKAAFSRTVRQLVNVRVEELTEEQRKENADAIARVGVLKSIIRFKPDKPSDLNKFLE